jgi:hypothetical protein
MPSAYTCLMGCEDLCNNTNQQSGCTTCPDCSKECCSNSPGGPGVSCDGAACEADLNTDDANCGTCGNACPSSQKCGGGKCQCALPAGFLCSGDNSCLQANCACEAAACAGDPACVLCMHSKISAPVGTTVPPCRDDDWTKFATCATAKCPKACDVALPSSGGGK